MEGLGYGPVGGYANNTASQMLAQDEYSAKEAPLCLAEVIKRIEASTAILFDTAAGMASEADRILGARPEPVMNGAKGTTEPLSLLALAHDRIHNLEAAVLRVQAVAQRFNKI